MHYLWWNCINIYYFKYLWLGLFFSCGFWSLELVFHSRINTALLGTSPSSSLSLQLLHSRCLLNDSNIKRQSLQGSDCLGLWLHNATPLKNCEVVFMPLRFHLLWWQPSFSEHHLSDCGTKQLDKSEKLSHDKIHQVGCIWLQAIENLKK